MPALGPRHDLPRLAPDHDMPVRAAITTCPHSGRYMICRGSRRDHDMPALAVITICRHPRRDMICRGSRRDHDMTGAHCDHARARYAVLAPRSRHVALAA
jgi:hypothetical protein